MSEIFTSGSIKGPLKSQIDEKIQKFLQKYPRPLRTVGRQGFRDITKACESRCVLLDKSMFASLHEYSHYLVLINFFQYSANLLLNTLNNCIVQFSSLPL